METLRPVAYLLPSRPYTGSIPNRLGARVPTLLSIQFKDGSREARRRGRVTLQHCEHCMLPTAPHGNKWPSVFNGTQSAEDLGNGWVLGQLVRTGSGDTPGSAGLGRF